METKRGRGATTLKRHCNALARMVPVRKRNRKKKGKLPANISTPESCGISKGGTSGTPGAMPFCRKCTYRCTVRGACTCNRIAVGGRWLLPLRQLFFQFDFPSLVYREFFLIFYFLPSSSFLNGAFLFRLHAHIIESDSLNAPNLPSHLFFLPPTPPHDHDRPFHAYRLVPGRSNSSRPAGLVHLSKPTPPSGL